jgi:hypothetical protein
MLKLYPDINPRLRRAAENNVRSHLHELEEAGRLALYPGKPRRASAARQRREVEHARQRDLVIRKAKRFEAEKRRAEIREQENPSGAEWIDPPRYELK